MESNQFNTWKLRARTKSGEKCATSNIKESLQESRNSATTVPGCSSSQLANSIGDTHNHGYMFDMPTDSIKETHQIDTRSVSSACLSGHTNNTNTNTNNNNNNNNIVQENFSDASVGGHEAEKKIYPSKGTRETNTQPIESNQRVPTTKAAKESVVIATQRKFKVNTRWPWIDSTTTKTTIANESGLENNQLRRTIKNDLTTVNESDSLRLVQVIRNLVNLMRWHVTSSSEANAASVETNCNDEPMKREEQDPAIKKWNISVNESILDREKHLVKSLVASGLDEGSAIALACANEESSNSKVDTEIVAETETETEKSENESKKKRHQVNSDADVSSCLEPIDRAHGQGSTLSSIIRHYNSYSNVNIAASSSSSSTPATKKQSIDEGDLNHQGTRLDKFSSFVENKNQIKLDNSAHKNGNIESSCTTRSTNNEQNFMIKHQSESGIYDTNLHESQYEYQSNNNVNPSSDVIRESKLKSIRNVKSRQQDQSGNDQCVIIKNISSYEHPNLNPSGECQIESKQNISRRACELINNINLIINRKLKKESNLQTVETEEARKKMNSGRANSPESGHNRDLLSPFVNMIKTRPLEIVAKIQRSAHESKSSNNDNKKSDDRERLSSGQLEAVATKSTRLKCEQEHLNENNDLPNENNGSSCSYQIDCLNPKSNLFNDDAKNLPDDKDHNYTKRDVWGKNIEFLLAVIGFAVDLGNVWRFPYVCYKNGGGAFLIPYTIMFVLGGLPIFYLEMSLGQYFSSGCLTVWKRVCPIAKGIGYSMCLLNFFTGIYYNTIISWAVFFFVESFTTNLPWTTCNNRWNTDSCKTMDQRKLAQNQLTYNETLKDSLNISRASHISTPTKDYFDREVLQKHLSTGIHDLGHIRLPLAIYLAVVFVLIYFAIWKGVRSTGKAVWITALLPYFILIPLLVRGIFLEGAWTGIVYYLQPQWAAIVNPIVWVDAAKQIYFSLGPGFGTLMALSSYNKFHHNTCKDAIIAAGINYFASFIAGLVIFAVLGYMSEMTNVAISQVATEGPGLVFHVYPEGLATMQFSAFWSVLFFTMVISLGIDSTFGGLESVITALCDEYPRILRAHRGTFIGILITVIYLCSLPTTTNGGGYVIFLLESYGSSSLLLIVLIETIIVCWLYGTENFCKNIEEMTGRSPSAYWRICWKYISPTILLLVSAAACWQELDKYHVLDDNGYVYPTWAPKAGLVITGSSIVCIPGYAIYHLIFKANGSFSERLQASLHPFQEDTTTTTSKESNIIDNSKNIAESQICETNLNCVI